MAMPFLQAMKLDVTIPAVCREREFVVTYSQDGCNCDHCRREKKLTAFSRTDAINRLMKLAPFAWPLKADPA